MPVLSEGRALSLHRLSFEAEQLSDSVLGSEIEVYSAALENTSEFKKGGFLGLRVANADEIIDREDLASAEIQGLEISAGSQTLHAPSPDVLTLARAALLATDQDEFTADDIENIALPSDAATRRELADKVRNFAGNLKNTQDRVLAIMEEIDEIVAEGLGLTAAEHETIRKRCQEFPLSVTVERPRFAWSPDRKRQARRTYKPGERFK